MDLNSIIRSDNAANIQLVVSAKDLRDLLDGAMRFAREEWKRRDEPEYYTRKEVEQLLHCSATTVVTYRKKGLLPEPVVMDGKVLYYKGEVHRAIKENKVKIKHVRL